MKSLISLRKRGLALFLVLTMCLSLLQVTAFAENSAAESTEPAAADNLNPDDGQAGENPPVCICTDKCGETPNTDCLVCAENPAACVGQEPAPVCNCETKCGDVPNALCPVCSAVGVDSCKGVEPAPVCICTDKCGETPNMDCLVCAENLAACVGQEPVPVCNCETKCGDVPNALCPVCSAVGADQSVCMGLEPAPVVPALVQAFLDAVAALEAADHADVETYIRLGQTTMAAYEAVQTAGLESWEGVSEALEKLMALAGQQTGGTNSTVETSDASIRVGETSYSSIKAAIGALPETGGTIVISKDHTEENVNLTISKPVTIQLDADLTLTGTAGTGISLNNGASLTVCGNGRMHLTGYHTGVAVYGTYSSNIALNVSSNAVLSVTGCAANGMQVSGNASILIEKDATLECNQNKSSGIFFTNRAVDIKVYGTLRCNENVVDGIYVYYAKEENADAQVTMLVDGGRVEFRGQTKDNGIVGNFNASTPITLVNGAEFCVDDNARQGAVYVILQVTDSKATANRNLCGLVDTTIISVNGTVEANDNGIFGWCAEGKSVIDETSSVSVKRNGQNAMSYVTNTTKYYQGAVTTRYSSTTLDVARGADFQVTDNYSSGFRFAYKNNVVNIQSGIISGNGKGTPSQGGGIYNAGKLLLGAGVEITKNHALTGGGIINAGTIEISEGAKLYNNHGINWGDDIRNASGSITLCSTGADWVLDGLPDCTHQITGWFRDGAKRWNASAENGTTCNDKNASEAYAVEYTDKVITGAVGLKAAHPDMAAYQVIHTYFVNDVEATEERTTDALVFLPVGQEISGDSISRNTQDGRYTYTSGADDFTLTADNVETPRIITLRYDRTVATTGRYTVIHQYYTNGTLDGSTTSTHSAGISEVIRAADITRVPTYGGNTYTYTSAVGGGFAIVAEVNSGTITLRYDRVSYRVVHEYYTNGTLDGSTNEAVQYVNRGTTVDVTAIQRQTGYAGATYTYTSVSPNANSVTVADDGSTVITLRYNRTTSPGNPGTPVTPVNPVTPVTPVTPNIPDTPTPAGPSPVAPGTNIGDEDVPLGLVGLNTIDHIAYIIGYEDGTVRPDGKITRAEVATIFFRLMTDEFRTANWSTENDFPDVAASNWFNNAVSTNSKAGIVKGYMDGTFKANRNITRAEFAAIAARFLSDEDAGPGGRFSDISGHWAEEEINRAVAQGWIKGYEDGTFRPDQDITRAEAVTLINRMLDRMPDKDHLLEDMIRWPDNTEDKWYYEDMQEATNSHDYDRDEMGIMEVWTEKLEERSWKEFEYEWATAASAPGREVADNLYGSTPEGESEGEEEAAPETTGDGEN